MPFQINYDDDQLSVIDLVNKELQKEGVPVQFEFDNQVHDGFEICTLVKTGAKE
jgi:hypothetical protein